MRARTRKDGTEYYSVLYCIQGKQTSTSFDDFISASAFCDLATKFGADNALATLKVDISLSTLTVEEWLNHHIDHLTVVDRNTVDKYLAYVCNYIVEPLESIPLVALRGGDRPADDADRMRQAATQCPAAALRLLD